MTATQLRLDEGRLEELVQRSVGYLTGAAVTAGIALGDRLGLYAAMADADGVTSDELAAATETQPRLIREWLDGQTAAGLLSYDPETDRYELPPEAAMVLQVETSPVFIAGGAELFGVNFHDMDRTEAAFRSDGAFPWKDHHQSLFASSGRFFRPGYLNQLTTQWIPALDGVADRLADGGKVADIGCGAGHTSVIIATAYPDVEVDGLDYHAGSLELARANAVEAGVEDRVEFRQADAGGYEGTYDLIGFFDVLHDLGDPVGAARHARHQLADGGTAMLVEPFAFDDRVENHHNPMAALSYHALRVLVHSQCPLPAGRPSPGSPGRRGQNQGRVRRCGLHQLSSRGGDPPQRGLRSQAMTLGVLACASGWICGPLNRISPPEPSPVGEWR